MRILQSVLKLLSVKGPAEGKVIVLDSSAASESEEISEYRRLGVIARHSIATLAFSHYCRSFGVKCLLVEDFVNLLWKFPASRDWPAWESEIFQTELCSFAFGAPMPAVIAETLTEASASHSTFRELAESLVEVALGSFYGAVDNAGTLRNTLKVVNIAKEEEFVPPNWKMFAVCRFEDRHGWGHRPSDDMVRQWRCYSTSLMTTNCKDTVGHGQEFNDC